MKLELRAKSIRHYGAAIARGVYGGAASLTFGVLRNALAQIPGGTFADRFILGVAVLVIVVMDRLATREER